MEVAITARKKAKENRGISTSASLVMTAPGPHKKTEARSNKIPHLFLVIKQFYHFEYFFQLEKA